MKVSRTPHFKTITQLCVLLESCLSARRHSIHHLFVLDIGSWHSLAECQRSGRGLCLGLDSLIIRDALRSWSGAQPSPRVPVKDPERAFLSTADTFKGHCKRTAMKLDSVLSSNRKFTFRIVYKAYSGGRQVSLKHLKTQEENSWYWYSQIARLLSLLHHARLRFCDQYNLAEMMAPMP